MSELDATFTALSDPTRRRVVELLRDGPLRAGELSSALEMSPPAMSRHLRVLRRAGLVVEEHPPEDARVRLYRLERAPFDALRDWVEEVEAFWDGELAAFAAHVERTRGKKRRPR